MLSGMIFLELYVFQVFHGPCQERASLG